LAESVMLDLIYRSWS